VADTSRYVPTFQLIDSDGDGLISAEELQKLMLALGEEIDRGTAGEMVRAMDSDGDGSVTLEELAEYLSTHPR